MNVQDFTYLLQNPDKVISPVHTKQLLDVLEEYPYFQAARALHLKGLKNLNSFKYDNALKIAAAYTSDREILFEFINTNDFLQNSIADTISGKSTPLVETEIISEEIQTPFQNGRELISPSEDNPLPRSTKDADTILNPNLFRSKNPETDQKIAAEKKKSIDLAETPPISRKGRRSFADWLILTSKWERKEKDLHLPKQEEMEPSRPRSVDEEKKSKFERIDKFIESNPKIVPTAGSPAKVNIKKSLKINKDELMTETLARLYLEQKKYKKATQAFKILSLKYPEKSSFFADRIKEVQKLQNDNSKKP